jgi:(p)ppGpp synthase/HD superfamily hydrolase
MKYTPRLERAIKYAAQKHDGQLRVEKERLPYITHLVSVAVLVSTHTDDEDCIIAALLHDVLEDTNTTLTQITEHFGVEVALLVDAVTEKKVADWKASKQSYIEQMKEVPEKALIIAAADKMHNILSRLSLIEDVGPNIFTEWSHSPAEYHQYHQAVYEIIERRLANGIVKEFGLILEKERIAFGV